MTAINIHQGDDPNITIRGRNTDGTLLDLSTYDEVRVIVKATPTTADADGTTLSSTDASPKVTVVTTDASVDLEGLCETPGRYWLHAIAISGTRRTTFYTGDILVTPA